ncbi:hypothetical protein Tco_0721232, partial [Tanacetum coccineum]
MITNVKATRHKWEGEAISLTPPMLAIAAAGNDAADEETVPAHAVAGSPAVARELLGADVNEDNFIERMTAIKERKKRA